MEQQHELPFQSKTPTFASILWQAPGTLSQVTVIDCDHPQNACQTNYRREYGQSMPSRSVRFYTIVLTRDM